MMLGKMHTVPSYLIQRYSDRKDGQLVIKKNSKTKDLEIHFEKKK